MIPPGLEITAAEAFDALTDVIFFVTVYIGILTTIYAVGEPTEKGEVMGRLIALWACAVVGLILVVWLVIGLAVRFGVLHIATNLG